MESHLVIGAEARARPLERQPARPICDILRLRYGWDLGESVLGLWSRVF